MTAPGAEVRISEGQGQRQGRLVGLVLVLQGVSTEQRGGKNEGGDRCISGEQKSQIISTCTFCRSRTIQVGLVCIFGTPSDQDKLLHILSSSRGSFEHNHSSFSVLLHK
ncbi:unnamed protein product [Amoebophrya sp. A25]|nr:unnamed protein product [Amoebophrya sp. A25]|eukprot:GSA25T00026238001.1